MFCDYNRKENIAALAEIMPDCEEYETYRDELTNYGGLSHYLSKLIELGDAMSDFEDAHLDIYDNADWYEVTFAIANYRCRNPHWTAEKTVTYSFQKHLRELQR